MNEQQEIETIRKQLLAIRDTGETNMFDEIKVQRMAYDADYYELVTYIADNPKGYLNAIITGKIEL